MASTLELLLEAEKRGLPIPPAKAALLGEARKRGLLTNSGLRHGAVNQPDQPDVPRSMLPVLSVGPLTVRTTSRFRRRLPRRWAPAHLAIRWAILRKASEPARVSS